MARRFRQRKDSPPPNFVLVALGFASGVIGVALIAFTEGELYSRTYQFGSALLNECFVLLPILGVAPFFIGKLLDLPSSSLPESRAFPPQWRREAAFAGLIGILVIASFAIELLNWAASGGWIRVVALALYLGKHLPWPVAAGKSFASRHHRNPPWILGRRGMAGLSRRGSSHNIYQWVQPHRIHSRDPRRVWPQRKPSKAWEKALVSHRNRGPSPFDHDIAC